DYDKLRWMNGHYIREIAASEPQRILDVCLPYFAGAGIVSDPPTAEERDYVAKVLPLVTERMKLLSEAPGLADFFFQEPDLPEEKGRRKWLKGEDAAQRLYRAIAVLTALPEDLTAASAEAAANKIAETLGV